ncbi:MAG: outer membrane lipid asymmetry maintenance protein MlaD [Tagaea sp.]|jgi:phospholipid/cholesterol/gamma-HCH transport system substrate-binding protein|nr:outer membrane lipid asymmetry maintenance protein MlaD [Azospirillum sp.]MCA3267198.1 outer membrane lipid asymmetry maintenance protein MlaD [Azospirillum sp.]MCZ8122994.1 outer membrane lipid asymmetry maintenance protein MlaD [Magnetospirillum sp.]
MGKNLVETLMGAVVLVVAGMFLVFAYSTADIRPVRGYTLTAKFQSIDGVRLGTDVKLAGIKVGSVVAQALDPQTYEAVLTLSIEAHVKLPRDTSAQITSEGLLGGTYIALSPGAEDRMLAAGGEIRHTQSPVNLVQLLGRFIFNSAEGAAGQAKPN